MERFNRLARIQKRVQIADKPFDLHILLKTFEDDHKADTPIREGECKATVGLDVCVSGSGA